MKKKNNMKRKIKIMLYAFAVISAACLVFLAFLKEAPELCIKSAESSRCFDVKIADNDAERERGLMFEEELGENKGMIFIFPSSGKYGFWMKNMIIPLDIIWIDENKTIVYISEKTPPCNETCGPILPSREAKYVLEINSGLSEKYGFSAGDKVWMHLV